MDIVHAQREFDRISHLADPNAADADFPALRARLDDLSNRLGTTEAERRLRAQIAELRRALFEMESQQRSRAIQPEIDQGPGPTMGMR